MAENLPQDREELDDDEPQEQDLLVVLTLSNRSMGTASDRLAIEKLSDELADAVETAGVGEFDGDETGGGTCTLFFAGPDPRKILQTIQPVLRRSAFSRGAEAVMGFGEDGRPLRLKI
ncbi:MAG: hypothetical protein RL148_2378 [Planctomycetota bacterium]